MCGIVHAEVGLVGLSESRRAFYACDKLYTPHTVDIGPTDFISPCARRSQNWYTRNPAPQRQWLFFNIYVADQYLARTTLPNPNRTPNRTPEPSSEPEPNTMPTKKRSNDRTKAEQTRHDGKSSIRRRKRRYGTAKENQ